MLSKKWWIISIYSMLYILPLCALAMLAVAGQYRYPSVWPQSWTLDHGLLFFNSQNYWLETILVSLLISMTVAIAASICAMIVTYNLAKHQVLQQWARWAYLPYSFSPVVFAFCLQYVLRSIGLCANYTGVWLAQLLLIFPYACLLFTMHWSETMINYARAAHNLGGSPFYTFMHVVWPLSGKMLVLVFFQSFLISWFDFGIVTIIGMGRVQTWMSIIYQYISESNIHIAAIASIIAILPTIILLMIQRHYTIIRPS